MLIGDVDDLVSVFSKISRTDLVSNGQRDDGEIQTTMEWLNAADTPSRTACFTVPSTAMM